MSEYDDIILPRTVYSLLALTATRSQQYETCSRAFIKLESLEQEYARDIHAYRYELSSDSPMGRLAFAIFSHHTPADRALQMMHCHNCGSTVRDM